MLGVVAALATPFLVTAMFRIIPASIPIALPFLATAGVAAGLWFARSVPRSVPFGIILASVAHALFLIWLFGEFEGLHQM